MNRDLGRNIILAAGRSSSAVQSILKQVCLGTHLIFITYLRSLSFGQSYERS